ncbi:putative zinc finger RNA-binding protein isoform X1 [Apostichopus japonicus]|uniref:Putative zinc finger RNA-binding protein isoform X1 n=1 Tax=Stichopus japonicus TaxID=307972 RepID=A0A2G8K855_STIJA|nr:putative zinc finger RNA-binding protein isoform X1 [Apostichopus japonicus]
MVGNHRGEVELSLCVEEAAIILTHGEEECKMTMKVSLTSPVMRDPGADADASRDPPDVLDKEKCLAALAALRHAKWFQAKAAVLPSCVVVIRVLRDLCDRIPTWAPLKGWPMELICERVISSAAQPLSPGDALRRIFEAVAGGLLLPGGPGIYDPCEREDTDVLDMASPQQKEEITASAQHALRLIVFRQVHKVLNMEPLYSQQRHFKRFNNRKRRREMNESGQEGSDGKKDKKEGEAESSEGAASGEGGAAK